MLWRNSNLNAHSPTPLKPSIANLRLSTIPEVPELEVEAIFPTHNCLSRSKNQNRSKTSDAEERGQLAAFSLSPELQVPAAVTSKWWFPGHAGVQPLCARN